MNKLACLLLALFIGIGAYCQSPNLHFDGYSDFVDLGSYSANSIRTIEFWFKLDEEIDYNNQSFITLIARETSLVNKDEFNISFQPYFMLYPGSIRFNITNYIGDEFSVYSNSNYWEADRWYNLAAVIDEENGMKLFIDGELQQSVNSYNEDIKTNYHSTLLASWGQINGRYFKGNIDAVRFSSNARYSEDYIPNCHTDGIDEYTYAQWNMNEATGDTIFDSGINSYNGIIYGAQWDNGNICNNKVLSFDGIDDYATLSTSANSGLRFIEFWFKPAYYIDNNLNDYMSLIVRETDLFNDDRFSISFQPNNTEYGGKICFKIINNANTEHLIYSDNDEWNNDTWYHFAATIDSTLGMMMFIDGEKQTDTNSYSNPIKYFMSNTYIGNWGEVNSRFYNGYIDDLLFSSRAENIEDFTPQCPDISYNDETVGLWHFNEEDGYQIFDETSNHHDGQLFGPIRTIDDVCYDTVFTDISSNYDKINLTVYPNPSLGNFNFTIESTQKTDYKLVIFNTLGNIIINETIKSNQKQIHLNELPSGIYFYKVIGDNKFANGKLIKH